MRPAALIKKKKREIWKWDSGLTQNKMKPQTVWDIKTAHDRSTIHFLNTVNQLIVLHSSMLCSLPANQNDKEKAEQQSTKPDRAQCCHHVAKLFKTM